MEITNSLQQPQKFRVGLTAEGGNIGGVVPDSIQMIQAMRGVVERVEFGANGSFYLAELVGCHKLILADRMA